LLHRGLEMRVVLDANIFFAALLKAGAIRKFLFTTPWTFLFPQAIFSEYEEHKRELLEKSGLSEEEIDCMTFFLFSYVQRIPEEILLPYVDQAEEIVKTIDPDDMPLIACALAHPTSVLWSDDKALKEQKTVKVLNTKEIMELKEKESQGNY